MADSRVRVSGDGDGQVAILDCGLACFGVDARLPRASASRDDGYVAVQCRCPRETSGRYRPVNGGGCAEVGEASVCPWRQDRDARTSVQGGKSRCDGPETPGHRQALVGRFWRCRRLPALRLHTQSRASSFAAAARRTRRFWIKTQALRIALPLRAQGHAVRVTEAEGSSLDHHARLRLALVDGVAHTVAKARCIVCVKAMHDRG
ncbi:uncharacterized protein SETTUDRAFT_32463 [Exserohilum turcica Et28A]|uniref:Uncharacterized protein n=1 Tax=Exserohilum turcicum (strain 28A) TaxID=671987 RepID=R0KAJ1_EXST2|nr:uncharacterized protein SETTUDRAFT_32463 [Exserohilum turcica Et28A]EOA85247.1 hypothetical protein SETTUDRAFT_32463 [Exserohilum turcica Et28A]